MKKVSAVPICQFSASFIYHFSADWVCFSAFQFKIFLINFPEWVGPVSAKVESVSARCDQFLLVYFQLTPGWNNLIHSVTCKNHPKSVAIVYVLFWILQRNIGSSLGGKVSDWTAVSEAYSRKIIITTFDNHSAEKSRKTNEESLSRIYCRKKI